MKRADAPWIGANPGDRVGAGLEACADVELKHDRRLRLLGENFHRTDTVNRGELGLMIVCRKTMDAEVIQKLAHLFGLTFAPLEIRSVEFDALVSHLCDGTHGA